ncbi:MAG: hypothetical protein ACFNYD_05990 [Bacteroides sp.]
MNGGGSFARRVLPYVVVFAITVAAGALILYFTQERELKGEDFDFERKVLVGEGIQRLGLVGDSGLYSGCYGVERQGEVVLLRCSEAGGGCGGRLHLPRGKWRGAKASEGAWRPATVGICQ